MSEKPSNEGTKLAVLLIGALLMIVFIVSTCGGVPQHTP